jgi:undecaprenyl-diphosphatase
VIAGAAQGLRWLRTNVDLLMLVILSLIILAALCVAGLAEAVEEGATQRWDNWVLQQLHHRNDITVPVGPAWLQAGWRDITALGSSAVLVLVTIAVAGYLLLRKQYRLLLLLILATAGGSILMVFLKDFFNRPRPPFASAEVFTLTSSFPSGHSMMSAVVYLTLGTLLARTSNQYRYKVYFISVAAVLAVLIGFSRVYLGVHYPTDVVAGWGFGLAWALLIWLVAYVLQRHGTIEPPRKPD